MMTLAMGLDVIPAKAGIHLHATDLLLEARWMPAFAGTTPRSKVYHTRFAGKTMRIAAGLPVNPRQK
jgi:hypothetical protein